MRTSYVGTGAPPHSRAPGLVPGARHRWTVFDPATLQKQIDALPGCPVIDTVAAAFQMAADGRAASMSQVMDLVTIDPGLCAQVLVAANRVGHDEMTAIDEEELKVLAQVLTEKFAEFEVRMHEMAWQGEPITGDALARLYHEITKRYYGHDQGVLVARTQELAPGIKLRMTAFGSDLAETGVISGTTAMVIGRIVDPPDNLVVQHLMDDGLACVVRKDHPDVRDRISREQYERLKHVNVLPPGRLRAGVFQALAQQNLKREVAVSVTHFLAVPEMLAVTDYCATLPSLICRSLKRDSRLKVLPTPVDLGTFPVQMAWHVRYRHDPAHSWLRSIIGELAKEMTSEET